MVNPNVTAASREPNESHPPRFIKLHGMAMRLVLATIFCIALTATTVAQTRQPAYGVGTVTLGQNLHKAGRYVEAERRLAGALDAIDRGQLSQSQLGRCLKPLADIYLQWGRHEDALRLALRRRDSLFGADSSNTQLVADVQDNHLLLANVYLALGRIDEARESLKDALEVPGGNRLINPAWILQAHAQLADLEEIRGDEPRAKARRQWVVQQSRGLVARIENNQLASRHDDECVPVLFNSLVRLKRQAEAIEVLKKFLHRRTEQGQYLAVYTTQIQIAQLHVELHQFAEAEEYLTEALMRHEDSRDNPYVQASLLGELAKVLKAAGRYDRAKQSFVAAAELDEQMLADAANAGELAPDAALAAWRRLRTAYTETGRHIAAIAAAQKVFDYTSDRRGAADRVVQIDKSQLGALYGAVGQYEKALPLLTESLEYWRQLRAPDVEHFAQALNNLASVRRATAGYDEAQVLFAQSLELRKLHLANDNPRLAEAYSNLASVYSARGQYATALVLYRDALAVCRAAGPPGEGLSGLVLQNLAMVYRSQGQLAKAADYSRQALDVGERVFKENPDSVAAGELAKRHLTQASLELASGDTREAGRSCQRALMMIEQHAVADEPLAARARRQLGTIHYQVGRLEDARREWETALAIQQRLRLPSDAARTLLLLADLSVVRRDFDRAELLYREALLQQQDYQVLPIVHFNAMVNLAQLLYYTKHEEDEAVALLAEAIKLLEIPRAETEGGGEEHRAEFFSRHAAAFDLLVDWSLAAERVEDAILYAERGRNRTFLDQLRLAGVDLRDTLPDDETGRNLRLREQQLSTRVSSLRALAVAAGRGRLEGASLEELAQQLRSAQSAYATVMADIRDHSPFYRELLAERDDVGSLAMIRRHVLSPENLLLIYHLGERKSFLIAVDGRPSDGDSAPARYFPLSLAAQPAQALGVAEGPLTRDVATQLVGTFLATICNREGARGLAGVVRSPRGMMDSDEGTALAEVLLPAEVRTLVAERSPEHLVVVPDGALHQMPLEALLVESDPAKFVLDLFPPITYAPSATILAGLAARPSSGSGPNANLLTVGDPVYPPATEEAATLTDAGRSAFLDLGGELSPLPGTAAECQRIYEAFGAERATRLLSAEATEGNLRGSLARRQFIHVAAHGLVDERNDNLFGAIALTPPPDSAIRSDDDGFLRLHEIHGLPLAGCELAALSACRTNVGPRRPLEAGSTLARAFLAAGTRRVVSSHWNVDDDASSELIGQFFQQLARELDSGNAVDYARLMHEARRAIRGQEKWSAPYYWAPFVLVGPAR